MNQGEDSSLRFPNPQQGDAESAPARRMFLFEAGWRIGVKTGSHREFCHLMVPGQDFYHRIMDREVYLFRNGEKLCLPCALRRGLITPEPKQLREAVVPFSADLEAIPLEIDVRRIERANESSFADR
jgi:hypothetical protein